MLFTSEVRMAVIYGQKQTVASITNGYYIVLYDIDIRKNPNIDICRTILFVVVACCIELGFISSVVCITRHNFLRRRTLRNVVFRIINLTMEFQISSLSVTSRQYTHHRNPRVPRHAHTGAHTMKIFRHIASESRDNAPKQLLCHIQL
jgi:hypothetical protein